MIGGLIRYLLSKNLWGIFWYVTNRTNGKILVQFCSLTTNAPPLSIVFGHISALHNEAALKVLKTEPTVSIPTVSVCLGLDEEELSR